MARDWRQGDVLPAAAAVEIESSADQSCRFIVCSHSCDIQEMQGRLLLVGRGDCVEHTNGNFLGGKSIKTLELKSKSGAIVHYSIESLRFVDVEILDRHAPWSEEGHGTKDQRALALWLSQRFDRLALPDSAVGALKDTGVEAALLDALKKTSDEILDVRVRFDATTNPQSIDFLILYDAGKSGAREAAKRVALAVIERANLKAGDLDGVLTIGSACEVADTALKYAQFRQTRPYRVEHISLRGKNNPERPVR